MTLEAPTDGCEGIVSPDAMQLPRPKFSKDRGDASSPTSAPSDSPSPDTDSEGTAEAPADSERGEPQAEPQVEPQAEPKAKPKAEPTGNVAEVDSRILRGQLLDRLEHLISLQEQSVAKYLRYREALVALQGMFPTALASSSNNNFAGSLLGTQPSGGPPGVWLQTSQVPQSSEYDTEWPRERGIVTLTLRELPAYYTQEMLLVELVDRGFNGHFDFLYVPYDAERACNWGHAIVNFTQPEFARQFVASFHGSWLDEEMRVTGRRLVVEQAPRQGYEANYYQFSLKWSGMPPLSRSRLCPDMQTHQTSFRSVETAGQLFQ